MREHMRRAVALLEEAGATRVAILSKGHSKHPRIGFEICGRYHTRIIPGTPGPQGRPMKNSLANLRRYIREVRLAAAVTPEDRT